MAAINRIPHGLLSFLGIKNGGRNPQQLTEQLGATFDLLGWYLEQNSESLSVNAAVNALGVNGNYWTVPVGETWAVLASFVNSQAALGAGQSLGLAGCWIRSANQQVPAPLTNVGLVATVGAIALAVSQPSNVTFVPPGAAIGVYCHHLVAGPVNVSYRLTVCRMLI